MSFCVARKSLRNTPIKNALVYSLFCIAQKKSDNRALEHDSIDTFSWAWAQIAWCWVGSLIIIQYCVGSTAFSDERIIFIIEPWPLPACSVTGRGFPGRSARKDGHLLCLKLRMDAVRKSMLSWFSTDISVHLAYTVNQQPTLKIPWRATIWMLLYRS